MFHYRVVRTGRPDVTVEAVGFAAHNVTVSFYRYDGDHDPANGVYANTINTHMFRMEDVVEVIMVDEPVSI
ncbi:MAG: hypothetical protein ACRCZ2_10670 [Fusobacteriaceae bacterium]